MTNKQDGLPDSMDDNNGAVPKITSEEPVVPPPAPVQPQPIPAPTQPEPVMPPGTSYNSAQLPSLTKPSRKPLFVIILLLLLAAVGAGWWIWQAI